MNRIQNMVGYAFVICVSVAVISDVAPESETVPESNQANDDLTEELQSSLQSSLKGDLGEALGELAGVVADLTLTVLDEAISEESVNAAFEETWTTQVQQHDTNQNGSLDRDEVAKIPDFRLDDDGNELSDEEFEALLDETFETTDLDKDGQITKEETRSYLLSLTTNVDKWIDTAKASLELKSVPLFEGEEIPMDSEADEDE